MGDNQEIVGTAAAIVPLPGSHRPYSIAIRSADGSTGIVLVAIYVVTDS